MTKFNTAPEVCKDCADGLHVFHIIGELGELYGQWVEETEYLHPTATQKGGQKTKKYIRLSGDAADELWLEQLAKIRIVKL